jgi:hypothetical protein
MYQDEVLLLASEVVMENMNQLALGIVYMVYITQSGISVNQMLLYPVQLFSLLATFFKVVNGREDEKRMSVSALRSPEIKDYGGTGVVEMKMVTTSNTLTVNAPRTNDAI